MNIMEGDLVHVQYKNLDFTGRVLCVLQSGQVEVSSVSTGEIYFVPANSVTRL